MPRPWRSLMLVIAICAATMSTAAPMKTTAKRAAASSVAPTQRAHDAFLAGMADLGKGSLPTALEAFDRSLSADPSFAPAACAAGYTEIVRGNLAAAIPHLQRAIELDPLYYEPREGLFFCLYGADRREEARQALIDMIRVDLDHYNGAVQSWQKHSPLAREPQDAATAYAQAYERDPTNIITILLHGNALYAQGDVEGANSDWRLAVTRDRSYSFLEMFIADAGVSVPDSIVHRIDRTIASGVDFASLRVSRALQLLRLSRGPEALADLRRVAALEPQSSRAHLDLAVVEEMAGNSAVAARELLDGHRMLADCPGVYGIGKSEASEWKPLWERFTQQNRDDVVAWILLGNAQATEGDTEAALVSHRRAVEADSSSALAYLHLGTTLAATGKNERAVAALARACLLDSSLTSAHGRTALVYAGMARAPEVVDALERVVRIAPHDVWVYRLQAMALGEVGQLAAAQSAAHRALSMDPGDAATYRWLAGARQGAGDRPGEIAELTRLLQIDPNDTQARALRKEAYLAIGDKAAAREDEAALAGGAPGGGGAPAGGQQVPMPAPPGGQMTACYKCNGTGSVKCVWCDWDGRTRCSSCAGSGRDYSGQYCVYCYGSGRRSCGYCYGTIYSRCDFCQGMGWVAR